MRKAQVVIGGRYVAKISTTLTVVRITGVSRYGGWDAVNERSGRAVRIKSAAKLRQQATSPSVGIAVHEQREHQRLCEQAARLGIPTSLDDPRSPRTVQDLRDAIAGATS